MRCGRSDHSDFLSIRRPKTRSTEAVIRRKIRFLFSFWHGQLSQGSQRAKAYLCWYDDYTKPGSAVVGSSNCTLAEFSDTRSYKDLQIEGQNLIQRLEGLRQISRLNPPEEQGTQEEQQSRLIRIVCSDGLVD